MRQLLGLMLFTVLAGRVIEASAESSSPIHLFAPGTLVALTICAICLAYALRTDG